MLVQNPSATSTECDRGTLLGRAEMATTSRWFTAQDTSRTGLHKAFTTEVTIQATILMTLQTLIILTI